jgi:hypothetical protein
MPRPLPATAALAALAVLPALAVGQVIAPIAQQRSLYAYATSGSPLPIALPAPAGAATATATDYLLFDRTVTQSAQADAGLSQASASQRSYITTNYVYAEGTVSGQDMQPGPLGQVVGFAAFVYDFHFNGTGGGLQFTAIGTSTSANPASVRLGSLRVTTLSGANTFIDQPLFPANYPYATRTINQFINVPAGDYRLEFLAAAGGSGNGATANSLFYQVSIGIFPAPGTGAAIACGTAVLARRRRR